MIRVLQVVYNMDACGGIQSFIMNIYRQIDRSKVQFDFLLCEQTNSHYEDEINRLGGKLYFIPGRKKGIIANKVTHESVEEKLIENVFTNTPSQFYISEGTNSFIRSDEESTTKDICKFYCKCSHFDFSQSYISEGD